MPPVLHTCPSLHSRDTPIHLNLVRYEKSCMKVPHFFGFTVICFVKYVIVLLAFDNGLLVFCLSFNAKMANFSVAQLPRECQIGSVHCYVASLMSWPFVHHEDDNGNNRPSYSHSSEYCA